MDSRALEFYRRISPTEEDVLSIKDNPDAEKFYCVPQDQMPGMLIEANPP